jgi:hypothetical protein
MVNWLFGPGWRAAVSVCARLGILVSAALCISNPAQAQGGLFHRHKIDTNTTEAAKPASTASQPPAFSIPVEPLGFFAPGAIYQGQRDSLVSLDFIDEDKLLFTFHAPGLIRRAPNAAAGDERQIRAVVLSLPQGTVTAEALWTVHDQGRYLWMLHDGHFLLRDQEDLEKGDATLELKPSLHFPGPLLWLEMDPTQQLMATDSDEPAGTREQPGDVPTPPTAAARITTDDPQSNGKPEIVLRILQRATSQVMLTSRARTTVHMPINAEGYLESLRGRGHEWALNLESFTGGSRVIGKIDSTCAPVLDFISNDEVLVTTCNPDNSRWMIAMSTNGKRMWNVASPRTHIWPRLIMAPDGKRVARETLVVTHAVDAFSPLSFEDVKGQLVEVYDASDGKVELTAPASPVLDGGGNVAISPSGKRIAILDAGAIQVYELPEAPQVVGTGGKTAAH